jgi:DNA-binding MarR family transcriptional regulator
MPSRLQAEIKQNKPFDSLRVEVILQLARTTAVVNHHWEQFLRVHGITATQYNVLRILRGAGSLGLCRHEVASRMLTVVPDVSRLLDRMTRLGMITRNRDPEDRRLVKSCITEKGLGLLRELDAPSLTAADAQLAHMSEANLQQLIELLEVARAPELQLRRE